MPELTAVLSPAPSPIMAPKILLMGPGGTGKTYALRTLVAAGITPFVIALDTVGMESVADIPSDKLHWKLVPPTGRTWKSLLDESNRLAGMTYDAITKVFDVNKSKQKRYVDVLSTMTNFKCDRCGKEFGETDGWSTGRAVVIDHFTEFCQASKEWAVGEKLILHEGEWQVAQNNVENFVRQAYTSLRCWFIVIAHIDRETDYVQGGSKIMVHALGRKLAPKLNPLFSDVVLAVRQGKEFYWDSAAVDVDLKTRNLPIESKMPPDFGRIVSTWKSRGGIVEPA